MSSPLSAATATASDAPLPVYRGPSRVALVHDWLNQRGGAENVLEELVGIFPDAPVYTSIYAPDVMPPVYQTWDIHTTFLQLLPGAVEHHQRYLPLYPAAFKSFDLDDFDLVLSNKSGFCHGVETANGRHVCYCLTPTRYLWMYDQYRERELMSDFTSRAIQPMIAGLRRWDYWVAQYVDEFLAISTTVQDRIRTFYNRESTVIYPPVDTEFFTPDPNPAVAQAPGDFFLIVSRLIPYKRIDLAVRALANLPARKLVIVGEGRDFESLRAQAPPNVFFLGRQSREVVRDLLRRCAAFLFPGLEDFGIAPVEALACGRPVIAFAGGGALDTVKPGVTGTFFHAQTVEALTEALAAFDPAAFDPATCRRQAERFSRRTFRTRMLDFLSTRI